MYLYRRLQSFILAKGDSTIIIIAVLIVGINLFIHKNTLFDDNLFDEAGFLDVGRNLVLEGILNLNFSGVFWLEDPSYCGPSNPRVGQYIMGIIQIIAQTSSKYDLLIIRFLMAILSVLLAYSFYYWMKLYVGKFYAFIATFLLLNNPIFGFVCINVVTDVPMMIFSLWAMCFATLIYHENVTKTRHWILFGLFIGLAISTKLYALGMLAVWLYLTVNKSLNFGKRMVLYSMLSISMVALVFFVTNPLLWVRPIYGIHKMTIGHVLMHTSDPWSLIFERILVLLRHSLTWFCFSLKRGDSSPGTVYQWLLCLPALILVGLGLFLNRNKRSGNLAFSFLIGHLIVMAYVSSVISYYVPKTALTTMAGTIVLGTIGLKKLFESFISRHTCPKKDYRGL